MQNLSTWARWAVSILFTSLFLPIAVHLTKHWIEGTDLYDKPQETANAAAKLLTTIAQSAWVQSTALFLGGLALGLWLDWLFRKLDRSRAASLHLMGYSMKNVAQELGIQTQSIGYQWPDKVYLDRAALMSLFINVEKASLPVPRPEMFFENPDGGKLLASYLYGTGTLLVDRHFSEAKAFAKKLKLKSKKSTPTFLKQSDAPLNLLSKLSP